MPHSPLPRVALSSALMALATACAPGTRTGAGPGDATFATLATQVLEDGYKRHPASATDLGSHTYDNELEDAAQAAVAAASQRYKDFRAKLSALDPASLSPGPRADREVLIRG